MASNWQRLSQKYIPACPYNLIIHNCLFIKYNTYTIRADSKYIASK